MGGMKANRRTRRYKNLETHRRAKRDVMELKRAYKFRIYPDAKHQSEINLQLMLSKDFYNLLLEKSISRIKTETRSSL